MLEADLAQKNLLPPSKLPKLLETETRAYHYRKERNAILEELKSHTRSVEDADPMLTQRVSSMYEPYDRVADVPRASAYYVGTASTATL